MDFAAEKQENTAQIIFGSSFKVGVKKCGVNGKSVTKLSHTVKTWWIWLKFQNIKVHWPPPLQSTIMARE